MTILCVLMGEYHIGLERGATHTELLRHFASMCRFAQSVSDTDGRVHGVDS